MNSGQWPLLVWAQVMVSQGVRGCVCVACPSLRRSVRKDMCGVYMCVPTSHVWDNVHMCDCVYAMRCRCDRRAFSFSLPSEPELGAARENWERPRRASAEGVGLWCPIKGQFDSQGRRRVNANTLRIAGPGELA